VLSSFMEGMETLPKALARDLDVRYGVGDTQVRRGWRVDFRGESVKAGAVVVAVPAHVGAGIVGDLDSELVRLLSSVSYAPIVVAALSISESQREAPLNGFGFLVPRTEGLRTLGTLFNSSLFPRRAPAGRALLTSFLGGALDAEILGWPEARVWEIVNAELKRVLGIRGETRSLRLFRYEKAIPQYSLGHRVWRESVRRRLEGLPGLFLTGNYFDGVSVPLSMEHGQRTAYDVIEFVRRTS
jgi:oxygen-dependent protoporphyrinogen oxidase